MKKLLKRMFLLTLVIVIGVSCEEEVLVFDGENGQSLVAFDRSSQNLPIVVDATGSAMVQVNVTTVSSQDRTFNISVVQDASTANPASYSVPGTVTIPAGQYTGTFVVDGTDNDVEIAAETLVLQIDDGAGFITGRNQIALSIFQVCPVDTAAFVGDYQVSVVTGGVFGCGIFPDGATVNLAVSEEDDLSRVFTTNYIEDCGFGTFTAEFTLNLVCNTVGVPRTNPGVGCSDIGLIVGQPSVRGEYDFEDDSSFEVFATDNVDSDCGGGPVQAQNVFTKV